MEVALVDGAVMTDSGLENGLAVCIGDGRIVAALLAPPT